MLNYIWLGMVLTAVLIGGFQGTLGEVSATMVKAAKTAVVDIALPLGGVITLWLGIIRLVERSGMIVILGRALGPVMRWLFPEVPSGHPAMGAMMLNMGANMLGAGNAATPLGLRAMQQLERLNPVPGTATNAMCTFLAINTSSVTLIPATAVGILAAADSTDPTSIIGTAIFATLCSTIVGVTVVKLLQRLPVFRVRDGEEVAESEVKEVEEVDIGEPVRLAWWKLGALGLLVIAFGWFYVRGTLTTDDLPDGEEANVFERFLNPVSQIAMPFFIAFFALHAALSGVKVFEQFAEGAKDGMKVVFKIIPFLVGIYVAMSMLRASGALEMLAKALQPVLGPLGFPAELLPMALIRPLTGGGSQAVLTDIATQYGGDHLFTKMAATMFGSTETTLYVAAVYFGAVAIRRTRHAIAAGLVADVAGIAAAVYVSRLVFG